MSRIQIVPFGRPVRWVRVLAAGLAIVLVTATLVACGGNSGATTSTGPGTTGAKGAQVVMKGLAFDPATVTIKVGETVTWTNEDSAAHTVVGDKGEFESGNLVKGASFEFTFDQAGTYTYHCGLHPSMKGTVVVE